MNHIFPGTRVFCRAANDGNGLRMLLVDAQKERVTSHVCGSCVAREPCDALHHELAPQATAMDQFQTLLPF